MIFWNWTTFTLQMYVVVLCIQIHMCVCVWSGGKENLLHLYDGSLTVTKVSVKTSPVHLLSLLFAPNQVKLFHNYSWLPSWTDLHPWRLTNFVLNLRYSDPLLISRLVILTHFLWRTPVQQTALDVSRGLWYPPIQRAPGCGRELFWPLCFRLIRAVQSSSTKARHRQDQIVRDAAVARLTERR